MYKGVILARQAFEPLVAQGQRRPRFILTNDYGAFYRFSRKFYEALMGPVLTN